MGYPCKLCRSGRGKFAENYFQIPDFTARGRNCYVQI